MAIHAPEGTRDLLPDEAVFWEKFKQTAAEVFGVYGYVPIDTPIVEQTELFVRGIGEATDVVSKEMFTAISGENFKTLLGGGHIKAKSKLSLRPEGTAGVVRSVIQHDLVPQGASPAKLFYAGPMFRAERPQKGRQRQFNQVGVECLGADDPTIDAEGIIMLMRFFERVGFKPNDVVLLINSMGCEKCRPAYRELVHAHLASHQDQLCDNCLARADINPLRAFDCKNPDCAEVMKTAPRITDHLCDDCKEHYERVKRLLDAADIRYAEDSSLVRGLDYYTRTVFEVQIVGNDHAQNAIGGGGRYDKLAQEIRGDGAKEGAGIPGFGFALGYDRCLIALQERGLNLPDARRVEVFVACATDDARDAVFELSQICRDEGIITEFDHQGRSLKSQFKLADKLKARFVAILGADELSQGLIKIRNMASHEEMLVPTNEVVRVLKDAM